MKKKFKELTDSEVDEICKKHNCCELCPLCVDWSYTDHSCFRNDRRSAEELEVLINE